MKYLLYKRESDAAFEGGQTAPWVVESYVPTVKMWIQGRATRNQLLWRLVSLNQCRIYVVKNADGEIIHSSIRVGKCPKFPFLKKGEYEIGPCETAPDWRGKGIYPTVLQHILKESRATCYMIVREDNASSIRGIEKSGFLKIGFVEKGKRGRWSVADGV